MKDAEQLELPLESKLDLLVEKIKKYHQESHEHYLMSSMMSGQGLCGMEVCKNLIKDINKIYGKAYKIPEEQQKLGG